MSEDKRVFLWGRNDSNECCLNKSDREIRTPQCVNDFVLKERGTEKIVDFFRK